MLSVVMLSFILLNVVILSVVMLNVVARIFAFNAVPLIKLCTLQRYTLV